MEEATDAEGVDVVVLGFILLVVSVFAGVECCQLLYRGNYAEKYGCGFALLGILAGVIAVIAMCVGLMWILRT